MSLHSPLAPHEYEVHLVDFEGWQIIGHRTTITRRGVNQVLGSAPVEVETVEHESEREAKRVSGLYLKLYG